MTGRDSVFAPAKINLFLHVGDKRSDGYHDICSLAAFADVGDELTAEPAERVSLSLNGPFAGALEGDADDNLILRAARALQDWASAQQRKVDGAQLTLQKNLPVASGIGGGSSDAAAALTLLNRLWRLHLDDDNLTRIGASLGADVPVCLRARASLMEGIGDRLAPWPALPELAAVLVNPRIGVATAEVFGALVHRTGSCAPPAERFASTRDIASWLATKNNDLQEPARSFAPIIDDVLTQVSDTRGCLLSRMSGSGATCFGLYASTSDAMAAATALRAARPHWWIVSTQLR